MQKGLCNTLCLRRQMCRKEEKVHVYVYGNFNVFI